MIEINKEAYQTIETYLHLQIGVLYGSEQLFLIKVGAGGSIYGSEQKYLILAQELHRTYGATVVVMNDPVELPLRDNFVETMAYISSVVNTKVTIQDILYIGFSRGAQLGACFGAEYAAIHKMLLVNLPMMINWHKSKAGLQRFHGEKAVLLFGSKDPSFAYIGFAERIDNPRLKTAVLSGEDHVLSCDCMVHEVKKAIQTYFE